MLTDELLEIVYDRASDAAADYEWDASWDDRWLPADVDDETRDECLELFFQELAEAKQADADFRADNRAYYRDLGLFA